MKPPEMDMASPGTVGGGCTGPSECSGPMPICSTGLPDGLTFAGGYCSSTGCDMTHPCGDKGVCLGGVDPNDATATFCFRSCKGPGTCERTGYSCIFGGSSGICLPTDQASSCDPTAAPASQCKLTTDQTVNGDLTAPCLRSGYDDVGDCQDGKNKQALFAPCNIGPKNCPAGKNCVYIDTSGFYGKLSINDKFKGAVCAAQPTDGTIHKLGESCILTSNGQNLLGVYTCDDNLACNPADGPAQGTCQQSCWSGTQIVLPGAKYKNPASACPTGTVCTNVFKLGGNNWPGICLPM